MPHPPRILTPAGQTLPLSEWAAKTGLSAAREAGSVGAAAAAIGDTPETAARHYVQIDPAERAKVEWARDRG